MAYEGMIAETITISGDKNEPISAYVARPLGAGPFPGMVLLHHAPGWDEWYREATRKFAHHGYAAISPNLYHRAGDIDVVMRQIGSDICVERDFLGRSGGSWFGHDEAACAK